MRNNLPTHLPIGPRNNEPLPPKKRVTASLAALQWAAERAGLSYGVFTQRLSPADEVHIQQAYDDYRKQRAKELEQHRKRYE